MANTAPNAKQTTFVPTGPIVATNVQDAIVSLSGASSIPITPITSFGAVGDGITDNSAAFVLAEASAAKKIFLPQGTFLGTGPALTKEYYGEGRIKYNGTFYGQDYSSIQTAPTSTNLANYGIDGDITHVNVGSYSLAAGIRNGLSSFYFNAPTTPKFTRFDTSAGQSGISARIAQNAAAGTGSITVNYVPTDFANGVSIQLNGATSETVVISGIVGNVVSFAPVLANSYTAGNTVTAHNRTMNQYEFNETYHRGGGDAYCWTGRMAVLNTSNRQPGQDHFFATATGGIIGGDLVGGADGVYLTSTEFNMLDTTYLGNYNISAISHVNSFQRTTDPRAAITTTLSAGASVGASAIAVTSATGFLATGGTVTISDANANETQYIASVSGTTVNLLGTLNYNFSAGATVVYQAQALRTTLSSGASAGATSIVVASNAGITVGKTVLTIIAGDKLSVNTVTGVVGPTISLGNTLGATFLAGATVSITNDVVTPYGTTWQGALYKSESTKSCDAIIAGLGKWKTGINFTNADFSSFNQAAIQLKQGHRIYFNSHTAYDVGTYNLWGNIAGDSYIASSPQSGAMQHFVANKRVLEYTSTKFSVFTTTELNDNLAVISGKGIKYDGLAGTNYSYFDGSYIRHVAGGVNVLSLNNSSVNVNAQLYVGNGLYFYNFINSGSANTGGATALPANPFTYLTIYLNGNPYKIPVYNN